jgi:Tfp pilus assembly protein PilF
VAQGLASEAEKNFREAITLDATNAGAHGGLAQLLESRGAYPEARAEAKAAVRLQPSAGAFVVLGRLDLRDNNVEAAAQEADAALALDPNSAAAQALKRDATARLADKP